jgi:hypothetical protein
VILSVQKQPDTNTLELTERIDEELADIEETLPPGMEINRGHLPPGDLHRDGRRQRARGAPRRRAPRGRHPLPLPVELPHDVHLGARHPAVAGDGRLRAKLLGITINTMTLGGMAIAIGALVDDAVIDVENVFRRLRRTGTCRRPSADRHDVVFRRRRRSGRAS